MQSRKAFAAVSLAAVTVGLSSSAFAAQPKINEIYYNPPGNPDAPQEYIEIAGKPNVTLNNYYLVFLENEDNEFGTGKSGKIDNVFDLSGMVVGSNGFVSIAQNSSLYPAYHVGNSNANAINWAITTPAGANPTLAESRVALSNGSNGYLNRGTGSGYGNNFDIANSSSIQHGSDPLGGDNGGRELEGGGFTAFLIKVDMGVSGTVAPAPLQQLDPDKNGLDPFTTSNGRAGWTIVDQIGDIGERSETFYGGLYANVNFLPGPRQATYHLEPGAGFVDTSGAGDPSDPFDEHEYLARFGEETGNTVDDWLAANLSDNAATGYNASLRNYGVAGIHATKTGPQVVVGSNLNPGVPYGTDVTTTIGAVNVGQKIAAEWDSDTSGNWSSQTNWSFATPDNTLAIAAFKNGLTGLTGNVTVNVDAGFTTGKIIFDNAAHSYILSGTGTITLSNQVRVLDAASLTDAASLIDVRSGSHFINANLALPRDVFVQTPTGTSLAINGSITGTTAKLTKLGAGTLSVGKTDVSSVDLQAGVTNITGLVKTKTLTLAGTVAAPTVKADLALGAGFILDYTTSSLLNDAKTLINVGKGTAVPAIGSFAYNGLGITSTAAGAANALAKFNKFVVVAIENADLGTNQYTTFGGLGADATSVLIRATYAGDVNLDGIINSADYAIINASFGTPTTVGWAKGDFNADGVIDASDYAIIDFGYLNQTGQLGFSTPVAVPEPTSVAAILLTGAISLTRRRRR